MRISDWSSDVARPISVTFGAGGSTLSYTPETVRRLHDRHGLDATPHISCVGGSREEIRALLAQYRAQGCKRLVALRGDMPSGMARAGDFRYASDLVGFIRAEHGSAFDVLVGCYPETHPQADHAAADLRPFKSTVVACPSAPITPSFYNTQAYFHFFAE